MYDFQVETPDIHPFDKARQRAAWLGVLATEPDGIATGACALVLHGVWGVPADLSSEVAFPAGRFGRGAEGVRVRLGVCGRRGAARLHGWWSQVDGRADSPLETWARLRCSDAGIPPTDLQVRITDVRGVVVAAGDLRGQIIPEAVRAALNSQ